MFQNYNLSYKKILPLAAIVFIIGTVFLTSFFLQRQNQELRSRAQVYPTCPSDQCYASNCPTGMSPVGGTCTNASDICCATTGSTCLPPNQCVASSQCPPSRIAGGTCTNQVCCAPQVCSPGSYTCESNGDIRVCNSDGSGYDFVRSCRLPEYCVAGNPNCLTLPSPTPTSVPNCPADQCYVSPSCPSGTTLRAGGICSNQSALCCEPIGPACQSPDQCVLPADCPTTRRTGGNCIGGGNVCCSPQVCTPNSYKCESNGDIRKCKSDGSGYDLITHCSPPNYCVDGNPSCIALNPSPTPATKYACQSNGSCVVSINGNFDNLSQCRANCDIPPTYTCYQCSNNQCQTFTSTTNCTTNCNACQQPPTYTCYKCNGSACETYTSTTACATSCNSCQPPPSYTCYYCSNNACESNISNSPCTTDCSSCQIQPPTYTCYDCNGNACVSFDSTSSCTTSCNSCPPAPVYSCSRCNGNVCETYTSTTSCSTDCNACQSVNLAALYVKLRFEGVKLQRPNKQVKVELENITTPGVYQFTHLITFTSDTNGIYRNSNNQITGITPANYNIYLSGPSHLRKKIAGITLTTGTNDIDLSTQVLLAGDIVDDNKVDLADYNQMVIDLSQNNVTSLSDLDFDGDVDIYDFNLMMGDFGKTGD